MKHTPGPWVVKTDGGLDPEIWSTTANEWVTCKYHTLNKPDARLIAAAPELLEGCKAALVAFEDGTKSPRRIAANIEYLRDVIAKAEADNETD